MVVGAIIAGFLIVSLLLETLTSRPKPDKEISPERRS
jgi:hypothetical protein